MKDILPIQINEKRIPRVLTVTLLLSSFLPVILNIFCLSPFLFSLENNVVYQNTAIPTTVRYISYLLTVLSFTAVYATIIFSKLLLNKRVTLTVSLLYCALLVFKIPATLLISLPFTGAIILADVIMLLFYFLLDILQFALIYVFISIPLKSYTRSVILLSEKEKSPKNTKQLLPITKPIDWYNPFLRSAIYMSISISAFRILERLISSIGIIPPESFGEVMVIITDYISDIIFGIVAYIIAIFIFNLLYDKLTKTIDRSKENKADEKDSSALFED